MNINDYENIELKVFDILSTFPINRTRTEYEYTSEYSEGYFDCLTDVKKAIIDLCKKKLEEKSED